MVSYGWVHPTLYLLSHFGILDDKKHIAIHSVVPFLLQPLLFLCGMCPQNLNNEE